MEPITRAAVITLIRAEHEQIEAILAQMSPQQIEQPGVDGDWSVRDLLAHITDWEQYLVQRIGAAKRGDPPPRRELPDQAAMDRINEQTRQASRDRSLAEIRAAFDQSIIDVFTLLDTLDDADLLPESRVSRALGGPVLQYIAGETWEHYGEHRPALEAWLRR